MRFLNNIIGTLILNCKTWQNKQTQINFFLYLNLICSRGAIWNTDVPFYEGSWLLSLNKHLLLKYIFFKLQIKNKLKYHLKKSVKVLKKMYVEIHFFFLFDSVKTEIKQYLEQMEFAIK